MLKRIIKKILLKEKCSSESYIKYLKKKGAIIGKGTCFFAPTKTFVEAKNTFLIKIGEYCKITSGVRILAHDYSFSVLRRIYHDFPQKAALTEIGNNVFIGVDSIILMGSKIGNNCIIGAGSVVSGVIPDNEIWAGNPAKFICTLDEYHKKCLDRFEDAAIVYIKEYKNRFGKYPTLEKLKYFNTLFDSKESNKIYEKLSFSGDNKREVVADCINLKKKYKNYEEFLDKIIKKEDQKK